MKVTPLHDRILVKRIEVGETVKGGIIIPYSAREKPMEGEVIAVGSGRVSEDGTVHALGVKPGERVLVGKFSGTEVKLDGVDHLILKEDEVLGVID